MKAEDFVHLHTHSDMSALDGCGKLSEYVKVAKERGAPAIAFTEHGTMRGFYQLLLDSNEQGIKPIFGIEFYVCSDMTSKGLSEDLKAAMAVGKNKKELKEAIRQEEKQRGIRGDWHLCAWAMSLEGLKNLFKLSSKSWLDGYYYKPRIDLKTLLKHKDGIAIGSACTSGVLNDLVIQGRRKEAITTGDALHEAFGDDLWLELMPHEFDDQHKANKFTLEMAKRWGKTSQLIATQDAHYIQPDDWKHHEVLLAVGTRDVMSNPDRFRFTGKDFYFKTRKEMREAFEKRHAYIDPVTLKRALDNTVLLAEKADCKVAIDRFKCLVPPIEMPSRFNGDAYAYLKDLCLKGWAWRDIPGRAEVMAARNNVEASVQYQVYIDRLTRELKAIRNQKFVDYFLLVYDLYKWVRSQKIACGPGRGSAAGSLVSFLTGITSVDPIEHGLLFERFISPDRIDMPDIDMDFEDVRRQEIIEHLRQKYGEDKVCQIATVGKMSGKQCLKDVSRVLEVPFAEVNQVTSSIVERSSGDERASMTIEDSFKEFPVCQEFNKRHPNVLFHAKRLEGMAKNLGIHAAGVVTSPLPLDEVIPLETRDHSSGNPIKVSAIDMYGVQAMGLLKMDVLGLRTMTVLREAVEAVKANKGEDIDLEKLDLNLPDILQGFTDHNYVGIFQYDSAGADKICMGVKFETFEDIAAMTALNRPGTARSGLASEYVKRKKNKKLISKTAFHPKVTEITSDTLGIIVYQEHVLKIFTDVAGFPPATADSLRKKIAKKWGDETIGKERENFVKGAVANTPGMTKEVAEKLMDAIKFFGSYGFNKSHATAYGVIAYWCMYLKIRHPLEFYWALLKNEPVRVDIQQIAKDAKKHKVDILAPDVNVSKDHFSIDTKKHAIRGSLSDIKFVGEAASKAIMEAQPFKSFVDLVERVNRRKVHKRAIQSLATAGALESLVPNTKWFLEHLEELWPTVGKAKWQEKVAQMLESSKGQADWSDDDKKLIASKVNPLAFGKHPIDAYQDWIKKNIKVKAASFDDEDFFAKYSNKPLFLLGIIVEVKYNQVGDFEPVTPDDEAKRRMYWGKRYANINIEDVGGKQFRFKVDYDIFDDFRPVVDSGVGTPVVVYAIPWASYQNFKVLFVVNLDVLKKKLEDGAELSIWESIVTGKHPHSTYKWKSQENKKQAAKPFMQLMMEARAKKQLWMNLSGVVTHVKNKFDKRGGEMGYFGLLGPNMDYCDCFSFASSWDFWRTKVKPGMYMSLPLCGEPNTWFSKHWVDKNKNLRLDTGIGKFYIYDSSKIGMKQKK